MNLFGVSTHKAWQWPVVIVCLWVLYLAAVAGVLFVEDEDPAAGAEQWD